MAPACLLTKLLFILVKSVLHHRRVLKKDVRIDLSGIFFTMSVFVLDWVLFGFFSVFVFFFFFPLGSNRIPTLHHTSSPNYHFLNVDIILKARKTYIHLHIWKCVCSVEEWGVFFLYQSYQIYQCHCITPSVLSPKV